MIVKKVKYYLNIFSVKRNMVKENAIIHMFGPFDENILENYETIGPAVYEILATVQLCYQLFIFYSYKNKKKVHEDHMS